MGVMKFTAAAYARMLKALLPPGRWRTDSESVLHRVMLANGDELARVSQRAADLVEEADPRTTDELLADFERALDLPSTGTRGERRGRIVSLLLRRQRYRPVDFRLVLAPLLGLDPEDVEVIEISRADAVAMDDDRAKFRFYVYRDPSLPGDYDIDDAQRMIDRMRPARSKGHVIESKNFLCDDEYSLTDRDILGS